jgi:preprotein translocase subunit YajC
VIFIQLSVLAQAGTASQASQGAGSLGGFMLPMIAIFVVMYFLMFRPQAKRQKEHRIMLDNLQKGDRVLTAGGIYGTVAGIKEKENIVILKIAENVKIDIAKSTIAQKVIENAETKS